MKFGRQTRIILLTYFWTIFDDAMNFCKLLTLQIINLFFVVDLDLFWNLTNFNQNIYYLLVFFRFIFGSFPALTAHISCPVPAIN